MIYPLPSWFGVENEINFKAMITKYTMNNNEFVGIKGRKSMSKVENSVNVHVPYICTNVSLVMLSIETLWYNT